MVLVGILGFTMVQMKLILPDKKGVHYIRSGKANPVLNLCNTPPALYINTALSFQNCKHINLEIPFRLRLCFVPEELRE